MIELWAIAKKVIREAIRSRTPVVLLLFLLCLIPILPFVLRTDGTLEGQLKLMLDYSMALVIVLLGIQTVYFAVFSLGGEIKSKQFFLVDTKPLSRWKFFVGKFIGLTIVNTVFLAIIGVFVLGSIHFAYQNSPEEQQKQAQARFFTAYRIIPSYFPQDSFDRMVDKEYEHRKKSNMLPKDKTTIEIRKKLSERLRTHIQIIPHGQRKKWLFKNIPIELKSRKNIQLKLHYTLTRSIQSYGFCQEQWIVGTRHQVKLNLYNKLAENHELLMPTSVIDDDGTITVAFDNIDSTKSSIFFPIDSVKLHYPADTFINNYLKGLVLILLILCFLSLLALFAAVFMSLPVAMLFVFFIWSLSMAAHLLIKLVPSGMGMLAEYQGFWHTASHKMINGLFYIIPNFSQYILTSQISNGIIVDWSSLGNGFLLLLLLKGGLLTLVGCAIFNRREVAKPL